MARTSSKTDREQKRKELAQKESEQKALSLLDDPAQPEEASAPRGWAYFAIVVGVALTLNFVVLIAITGGR